MKSVHPRIAMCTIGITIIIIFSLIELVTGLPLLSKYTIFVGAVAIIPGIILFSKFNSNYNPEDNDNVKASIFLMSLIIVFIIILSLYRKFIVLRWIS